MECPYKNHQSLQKMPCHWISHPEDTNIRICDTCQNHYDLRDFRKFSDQGLTFVAVVIILLMIITTVKFESPNPGQLNNGNFKPKISDRR